jgi:transcriptional regulator with XRE-family HTH domain
MSKNIFEQALNDIPQDIQEEVSWNFDIIDQITFILKKKGMSQKDLAVLLGKKESEISKWMRGTHNFTLSTIWLLQKALGEKIIDTPCNLIKTRIQSPL